MEHVYIYIKMLQDGGRVWREENVPGQKTGCSEEALDGIQWTIKEPGLHSSVAVKQANESRVSRFSCGQMEFSFCVFYFLNEI